MAIPKRHVLTLELEFVGVDDVSGRLSGPTGAGLDFVGWLGLAGAIETFAPNPAAPAPTPPNPTAPAPAHPHPTQELPCPPPR